MGTATEEIKDEVTGQLDTIKAAVDESQAEFTNFLTLLGEMAELDVELFMPVTEEWAVPSIPEGWKDQVDDLYEELDGYNESAFYPNFPAAPTPPVIAPPPNTIRTLMPGTVPTDPGFSLPDRPSPLDPQSFTAPELNEITPPEAPDYEIPEPPDLEPIDLPDPINMSDFPEFLGDLDALDVRIPDHGLDYFEPLYKTWHVGFSNHTQQLTDGYRKLLLDTMGAAFPQLHLYTGADLDEQISNMAKTGLSGLPPDVEQAIFQRAMATVVDQARINLTAVDDEFSAAGYPRPPGSLRAKRDRIRHEIQDRIESFKRDFITKQVDLVQGHTKFLQEMSVKVEETDRALFNAIYARQLDAAKAAVEASARWYDMKLEHFKAQVSAYNTEAIVFKTKVEARMIEVDRYRLELDAAKLLGDLEIQKLEKYKAELSGIESLIRIYMTEMEGTKLEVELEKRKFENFRAGIEAYSATVNAKVAEYNGYEAAASGETAKYNAYRGAVEAYRANIEAQRAGVEADAAVFEANASLAEIQARTYQLTVDGYRAGVAAVEVAAHAAVANNSAKAERFKAEAAVAMAKGNTYVAGFGMETEARKNEAIVLNQRILANLESMKELAKLRLSATQTGGDLVGRIVQATISQMNQVTTMSADFQTIE